MPGAFVIFLFPTFLLGSILVSLGLDVSGGAAIAMVLFVTFVGVAFVSLALSMRRQHPSHDAGDQRLLEDRFPPLDDDVLDLHAVPVEIHEQDTGRFRDLERWADDGAPRSL
jgi:hypothetical protein